MTQSQIDEAKRLAEEIIKIGGEPKVLDICEVFLQLYEENEKLKKETEAYIDLIKEVPPWSDNIIKACTLSNYKDTAYMMAVWMRKYSDLTEGKDG